jgi:hypothetical protein
MTFTASLQEPVWFRCRQLLVQNLDSSITPSRNTAQGRGEEQGRDSPWHGGRSIQDTKCYRTLDSLLGHGCMSLIFHQKFRSILRYILGDPVKGWSSTQEVLLPNTCRINNLHINSELETGQKTKYINGYEIWWEEKIPSGTSIIFLF